MDYLTYEERLYYLLEMIKKGRLISQAQAGKKFNCSDRTIRRMLTQLKLKGHRIEYSHALRKYIYKEKQFK